MPFFAKFAPKIFFGDVLQDFLGVNFCHLFFARFKREMLSALLQGFFHPPFPDFCKVRLEDIFQTMSGKFFRV